MLSHYLQEMGMGLESIVGLCFERSFEMIIGLLAILKAGGAYLPLDLSFPADWLAFMLADARAQLLLTQSSLYVCFAPTINRGATMICLDQWLADAASPAREENPVSQAGAEHLAYVIYASGSTGLPKGVAVSHRGVLRLVCNTNYIALGSTDRIAQVSNVSFDAATFEIWGGALLHGGQMVGIAEIEALLNSQLSE